MAKSKRKNQKRSYAEIEREMHARGSDITKMIRIFSTIKRIIPDGPREGLEQVARGYAERNDDRGSVCKFGQIDFQDEGMRFKQKTAEERSYENYHKIRL